MNANFDISFFKRKQTKISKKATMSCSAYPSEKAIACFPSKSLTSLLEAQGQQKSRQENVFKSRWNWSTSQLDKQSSLEDKTYERIKSSNWTNLKIMMEFIQKSRETLQSQDTEESIEEDFCSQNYTSLTFLGQLYDVEISSDEEVAGVSEADDVFG